MTTLHEKAKQIQLLICDLDGVLTEGYLVYGPDGELHKKFHVQDGLGLRLLQMAGIETAIITTAKTPIITKRCQDLKITHCYQGQVKKTQAYEDLLEKLNLSQEQVAYIGDDLPDLNLIRRSGLGVAVANANERILEEADYITQKHGGRGAVRELCDLILHAQNKYDMAFTRYENGE